MALENVHRLIRERGGATVAWSVPITIIHVDCRGVTRGVDSVRHHFRASAVLVGPGTSNVLVVIVAQVFFCDRPLCHYRVLQIVHHLILRPRLNLEWADSTLLFHEGTIELLFFFLEIFDPFQIGFVFLPEPLHVFLEGIDFFFAQAQQVLVPFQLQLGLALLFLLGNGLFLE